MPGAREALSGLTWARGWGPFAGEIAPLYHPGAMLALGFGAVVGNITCRHNIVAAAATVLPLGQEGAVLRRTLELALGNALLGGPLARFVFG